LRSNFGLNGEGERAKNKTKNKAKGVGSFLVDATEKK
jgi:hypothetical protein